MHYVMVPGINGSGPDHWQTLWQGSWSLSASRISPSSWDTPDLAVWHLALDRATERHGPSEVVLIAHSLGCLAAASWLARRRTPVRGAFLVAAPDSAAARFPADETPTFTAEIATPITVPGLLVSSDDDPYCAPRAARRLADAWAVGHVSIGTAGHINASGAPGAWAAGQALLGAFTAGLGYRPPALVTEAPPGRD